MDERIRPWMVPTALAACFPLGLYLLWTGNHFNTAGKVALTVATAALSPALVLVAAPVLLTGAVRLLALA
ncbi:MAG: hypothetical protein ACYC9Q_03855 [Bacillota bacterium]